MPIFKPPSEAQKALFKDAEEKRIKQENMALDKKKLAAYQQQHEQCEVVLRNLFELLLLRNPRPTPEIRFDEDSLEKDQVIAVTAKLLMSNRSPIQENRLDDPHYLHHLALLLIRSMVVNYYLKHDKAYQALRERQDSDILNFADSVQNLANKTVNFQEQDALNRFAHFLRNNNALTLQEKHQQQEMNDLLNELSPNILKHLQQPALDLIKKINEITDKFMKDKGPQMEKDIHEITDNQLKAFKLPGPKPQGPKTSKENEEQATCLPELSDNPYRNLVGLIANTPGVIAITVNNNLGNGLGLLNSMRAPLASSTANIDSWNETKEEIAGIGTTLFTPTTAKQFFEDNLKPALDKLHRGHTHLPSPFDIDPNPS